MQNQALALVDKAQQAINIGVEKVRRLHDATRRTSQLADQLLTLSGAQTQGMDRQPLQSVDLNELCENALQYTPAAGTVTLRSHARLRRGHFGVGRRVGRACRQMSASARCYRCGQPGQ